MRVFPRIALIGIILWLCVAPLNVVAQGGSDSSGLLISQAVEVVFPAAVVFQVTLATSPTAISAVQLQLVQDNRPLFDGVVRVDFADEEDDATTTLYFDWPLPENNTPTLFTEIAYEWRILLEDMDALTQQGTFMFQPGAGEWRVSGEAPLRFGVVDSALNLSAVRQAVLPAYELLAAHTGLTPDLQWVALPRDFMFCRESATEDGEMEVIVASAAMPELTYPCSEEAAERILAQQGYAILRRGAPGLLQFQEHVLGALFDVFYGAYWASQPVPAWFESGLQRYYSVNPEPLRLRQAQEAARASLLYDAEQLQRGPVETDIYDLWTAQSASLVLYIADRFGAEAPFTLAQAIPDTGFEAAFAALVGQERETFLVEWERWLFTDAAAQAAAWTVYLPATATPRPTRTSTPVPSATSPATVTPGLTPTLQMPDASVQLSPSPAPEERPLATNTPRPPGSLETRVPTAPDTAPQERGICGAAALPALLMPGLALVVAGYRRKQA